MHIKLVTAGVRFVLPCNLAYGLKQVRLLQSASTIDQEKAECIGFSNLVVGEVDADLFVSDGQTRFTWADGGLLPRDETDGLVKSWANGRVKVVTIDVEGHDVRSRLRDLGMKVPDRFPMLGFYTTIIPPGWACEFEDKDFAIFNDRQIRVIEAAYPYGLQSTFQAHVK